MLYKVVEVAVVTDEELEKAINEWVEQGWTLDTIQFAMRESSKRPSMAFVLFVNKGDEDNPKGV
ncbi:MAG: DUF4177 domain-containing protein [Candidatus Dadabacteria bacterium]|nr:DUF4177 domain-containing protein [Candidatus Dadabacteria bacterium]